MEAVIEEVGGEFTIFDAVHGQMTYPGFVRSIIDTPEFQRLRSLKQLGTSSFVFPNATHTRFEHCLGVCFLVEKLLRTLEKNFSVQISDIHRKCVMLAGLLHDLGHGPFSHMWEDFVHSGSNKLWTHEESSCDMARQLFANNNIKLSQEDYEHYYAEQLICALITGNQNALKTLLTPDTMYLSEIVHNKRYKIDVDKWDYLLRDLFFLDKLIRIDTGFFRFFNNARVVRDQNNVTHIGYRADEYDLIVQLFEARARLHIECYQHPTTTGICMLLIDAFTQAEQAGFRLMGAKISEAHNHFPAYLCLDDSIVNLIKCDTSSKLQNAQRLLTRIHQRNIYCRIFSSSKPCDIEELNRRFARDDFFQVHTKIPHGFEMAPHDVPLYDKYGELVDNQKIVESIRKSTSKRGFYEQYHVFCKSATQNVITTAREHLVKEAEKKFARQ